MNLLPFVVVILTVLALFFSSHFHRYGIGVKEGEIYRAYFQGLRAARNHKEGQAYSSLLRKQKGGQSKNENTFPKSVKKKTRYFREEKLGWENGRLNLSSLTHDPQKWPKLKSTAIQYILSLYGHAKFFPKDQGFVENLLDALVEIYCEDSLIPFHQITLKDPSMNHVFRRMIHGTHTYDLENQVGYPPFGDFFSFENRKEPPMFFQDASTIFIKLALGKENGERLIKAELAEIKETGCHLSSYDRKKLEFFLRNSLPNPLSLDLFEYLHHSAPRNHGKHVDPKTQITVRVP